MTKKDLDNIGIVKTEMVLRKKDGTLLKKRDEKGSFWTTAFSFISGHFTFSKNLTTENTFTFKTVEDANAFKLSFETAKPKAYDYFMNRGNTFDMEQTDDPTQVVIKWGKP